MPLTKAGAEQAAGGETEQALHNLARAAGVPVVDLGVEGVQPGVDTVAANRCAAATQPMAKARKPMMSQLARPVAT